jgi:hypothetical protein
MNEEYGYTKAFRDQVLRDADTYGVLTAAAKHRVSKSSIYRWRQEQERERIERESWIDICARHINMETAVIVLSVFVGIVALSHAVTFYLGR